MRWGCLCCGVLALWLAHSVMAAAQSGPKRLDFDDRVVQGQSLKASSVYLFNRAHLQLPSLIRYDRTFSRRTVQRLFPQFVKPAS